MKGSITVTDHALVRWLERVHGINIKALKKAVITPGQIKHIESGAAVIKSGGHQYVIEGRTVVTVI